MLAMHVGLVAECFGSAAWDERTSPPEIALGLALDRLGVDVTRFSSSAAALDSSVDILHLHFASPLTYEVARHARVPYCLTLHDGSHIPTRYVIPRLPPNTNRWERALSQLLIKGAARVIALCQAEAESLSGLDSTLVGKVAVIPNGVDVSSYRQRRRASGNELTLLYVGQLAAYKGPQYLLKAFRGLLDRHVDAKLRIVSHHSPLLEFCKSLSRDLGIADRVEFISGKSTAELIEEYSAAEIYVQASLSEGAPITILESMASGLAIVATDVACIRDQIGEAGILVPPGDEVALSAALYSLAQDSRLRDRLGKLANERCEALFSMDRVGRLHLREYGAAIEAGPPARKWPTRVKYRVNWDAAFRIRPRVRRVMRSVVSRVAPSWYSRRQVARILPK